MLPLEWNEFGPMIIKAHKETIKSFVKCALICINSFVYVALNPVFTFDNLPN